MTDEQPTITMEQGVRLLQIENGDRLAFLRMFQSTVSQIESSIAQLKRDIAQYNISIEARNAPAPTSSELEEEVAESEDE